MKLLILALLAATPAAHADLAFRNSLNQADNTTFRDQWLADVGISLAQVQHTVDFEQGFVNNQNVSGVTGLFPAGLVITDTSPAHAAIVRSTGFGGAQPIGTLSLAQNEQPFLELQFPLPGVDYLALNDIDHAGTAVVIHLADGAQINYTLDSTITTGHEFLGIYRNDLAPIVRIQMDATGDSQWGIDTIMYGVLSPPCTADFNHDAAVNSQDFFDFLTAFFANDPSADFNADTVINSQDFFDFLAAFFVGC